MDPTNIIILIIGIFIAVYGAILLAGRKLDQERRDKHDHRE